MPAIKSTIRIGQGINGINEEAEPENEYSMMELARRLGMDVPETQLLPINQIANIPQGVEKFGDSSKKRSSICDQTF